MLKMEENKSEGQNVGYFASSGSRILRRVEDRPGLVVVFEWRVGCVTKNCVCLCV